MAPTPPDTSEQPTLRVMRLYKPRLDGRRVLPSCSVAAAPSEAVPTVSTGEGNFALGSALKLPDSFGNIYLGETFTAYISVLNHMSSTVLVNASLSAKLQSPTGRADLEDRRMARGASVSRPNPAPLLSPSENLDMIVEHTLGELGTHTLRVTVRYQVAGDPEGSEPRSMRKFYRFSVMNPVNMSSVCTAVRGGPFVELQLVNTTQVRAQQDFRGRRGCVGLGLVARALVPAAGRREVYDRTPTSCMYPNTLRTRMRYSSVYQTLNRTTPSLQPHPLAYGGLPPGSDGPPARFVDGDGGSLLTAVERFDGRVLLRPEESHQLIYSVRPNKAAITTATILASTLAGPTGVKVCWRTTTGESGSVRSGPIVFEAVERPEVEVTVDGLPDVLKLGRVAACVATVRNRSSRPMTLQLQFRTDGMVGVYVHGQSFRNLGELLPGTSVRCPLQLLALVAGLHELRGCTVADMHTAQEFPQGKLKDVLVEFPNEEEDGQAVIAAEDDKHGVLGL
ncbi:unnamed protein product [Scytosiphon promiscuus]